MSSPDQKLVSINPVDVLLWTFRRNETDVVNLYDALTSLMQIATGGNMLNFGYWKEGTSNPFEAQTNLCRMVADMAEMKDAQNVLDIGSGFSEPATIWKKDYPHLKISCINVNQKQLASAAGIIKENADPSLSHGINLINSTATKLPLADNSVDRIIALESAQHFKPFSDFVIEGKRILKRNGVLVLAIPVMTRTAKSLELFKLGILSFTWSSEHYALDNIRHMIERSGLKITSMNMIGSKVYQPLADYYVKNREFLRARILGQYPSYIEKILFKSLVKMRDVSENTTIDYVLLKSVAE
ncbi:MAG: class I SAM-dependent methyltransferase [Thaumarchaeota archaeon]|nr:class I SAM-dependent methyltransferase [Nitrososphaerota archaeon]